MNPLEIEFERRSSSSEFEFRSGKPEMEPISEPKSSNLDTVLSTKTPDKSPSLSRRSWNNVVSFPLRDDQRKAETGLRRFEGRTSEIKSVKRQILSSPRRSEASVKLPERFEILGELFNALDTSIRLLKLRGSSTTFASISPKIECLTNRRFLYAHLAQMKHVFPEAIQIKRVLKYDESTCCMKPDLHVTLNTEAIPHDQPKCESKNMALRKMFQSRLADFFKAHPKDEIPEELLPEPFNSSSASSVLKASSFEKFDILEDAMEQGQYGLSVAAATSTDAAEEQHGLSIASHPSPSPLNRHFTISIPENTILASPLSGIKFSAPPMNTEECNSVSGPKSTIPATPIKDSSISSNDMASTPVQPVSTPARIMSFTPELQPSKRCLIMSPDDDSVESPSKLVRLPSRTRSLKFDLEEDERAGDHISGKLDAESIDEEESSNHETDEEEPEKELEEKSKDEPTEISDATCDDDEDEDDDSLDILPASLLQSIKDRVKAAADEHNPAISLAKRRRRMIASLPKLFNFIHFLFQSTRRTVITKEELLYRIIAGQSDTTDRKEVEEQLSLMLELVPQWISESIASSGDIIVGINKMSAADTIRARIEEATMGQISS